MAMAPQSLADQARALVEELAALMTEYPTEDPDVTPVALAHVTVAGEDVGTVPLMPGQVAWLRSMVADQAAAARAAHPDQPDQGRGSGRAGG
ncbi:hypothetical protein [Actinomadura sp. WAC 06369]|uniref:hypothetical protein n=1 Tax=Actinomadura sp. WAC 06369 TaxID=2203193 RepID=UPI000F78EA43|nr:hypothetical protein [Actinomadura sp. WAC 06369]RSN51128.1 hypothetical protein DMH08_31375 [Actinomadura sp. WAC 06369]